MRDIQCAFCGKLLVQVPDAESDGAIAAHVQQAGYLAKNPILYTGKSQWLNYCSRICQVEHYQHVVLVDVPQDKKDMINKVITDLRKNIPEMARQTAMTVAGFRDRLLALQKK